MDYLQELNESQRQAVQTLDGPLLILAGAGSGKTRVLTSRCAFAIEQGIDAFRILALTFTNKAAKEMKNRIHTLIGPEARNLWMGTFHSTFGRILRIHAEKLGYTSNFTIYDQDDAEGLVKRIINELNLDDKKFKPSVVMNQISSAKNVLVDPEEFAMQYVTDTNTNIIARVYKVYQTRLFSSNAMDFDDLLFKTFELLRDHAQVKDYYQNFFRFLMVDEFQDTNIAQYSITRILAEKHRNICVVGDDAQSIYSFRGATIANILNFQKDYPEAKIFKLEQNYRSTGNIVNAANTVIERNKGRLDKIVFTENENGEQIRVMETATEGEEARFICDSIREQKGRYNFHNHDFVILYRTNAQSRAVETELRRAGIKYRVFGGLSFYRRKEIKDVLAYFKLAINPKDEAALMRVINYPARGIGKTTTDRISVFADEKGMTFWEALAEVDRLNLGGRASKPVNDFVMLIRNFGIVARDKNAFDAATFIAQNSGILKDLHQNHDTEGLSRWENVQELLAAAKEFIDETDNDAYTLDAFLAEISLLTDADQEEVDSDYVSLMTIHSAKGLEFQSVFVAGMEEGLFPSFMSLNTREDMEEERRLFYVAITRAMKKLTLSLSKSRFRYGSLQFNEASRFLEEIDQKYLDFPSVKKQRETVSSSQGYSGRLPITPKGLTRVNALTPSKSFVSDDLAGLQAGMNVIHEKFGEGKVLQVDGSENDRKATVFFQEKGNKVLLLKYARLKIVQQD